MALSHREEAAAPFLKEEKMITSVSNPQMKRIKELLNKSKQRRKEKCFVAEGIRMVAETPADRLERVYVSESFYRHPPELRGLDLSKAQIVVHSNPHPTRLV